MSGDTQAWAGALEVASEQALAFEELARTLGTTAPAILRLMIARVIQVDHELAAHGLTGLPRWREEAAKDAVEASVEVLPLDIRPTEFMWPPDKSFPWTAPECLAAVIGYEVKWHGTKEDFLNLLRGKWELSMDGYASIHQS